jgi:hypothetical protein
LQWNGGTRHGVEWVANPGRMPRVTPAVKEMRVSESRCNGGTDIAYFRARGFPRIMNMMHTRRRGRMVRAVALRATWAVRAARAVVRAARAVNCGAGFQPAFSGNRRLEACTTKSRPPVRQASSVSHQRPVSSH